VHRRPIRWAARPDPNLKTLDALGDKTVILGVINMGDPAPETPETVAALFERHLQTPGGVCGLPVPLKRCDSGPEVPEIQHKSD
jgi:hypothetical protein